MNEDRFILPKIAHDVLTETVFFTEADCPFAGRLYPGENRVLVIAGENASGKSLMFRMMAVNAQREHGVLPITISIRERTGAGVGEMNSLRRTMMFGDEASQSTGAASATVVDTGFKNANRDAAACLMLDEPEIGLSDGYAGALGEYIGQKARTQLDDHNHGVVVVTHSRPLVRGIVSALGQPPAFLYMGSPTLDLRDWLAHTEVRTVSDLVGLREAAGERRKLTQRILNRSRRES